MKLSDLNPQDIQLVNAAQPKAALKLSDLNPEDVQAVAAPTDVQTDLREAAQGATAGLGDEFNGVVGAAGRALGVTNLGTVRHLEGADSLSFDSPTLDPQTLVNAYRQARDSARSDQAADQKVNPGRTFVAQGAGMMANPLMNAGSPVAAGAAIGLGNSNADLTHGDIAGAAKDTATGAVVGGLAGVAGNKLGQLAQPVSDYLSGLAERQAVKATGATGATVYSKFPQNAGRELLDRGIVGFGDSQASIAKNAQKALDASGKGISSTLSQLDNEGASVSREDLLDALNQRANELKSSPSQASTARQIGGIAEDVANGPEEYSLSKAEAEKRGFQSKVNWNNPDGNAGNSAASDIYRQAVEDSATESNPELSGQFQDDKNTYGLLSPISEAAAKKAATNGQSSLGLYSNIASHGVGAVLGGEEGYRHGGLPGALAGATAGAVIAPRLNSSFAVGADWLSGVVASTPSMLGKWAPVLTQAAARGDNSLAATDYVLQQTDPDYRQHLQSIQQNRQPNSSGQ